MKRQILVVENVSKTYITEKGQDIRALESISLKVKNNDFISLLGPSGCGKSTLLRIVAGLEPVTGGGIFYAGKPLGKANNKIGMVFQDYSLLPWRTVIDNVTLGLEFAGISKNARREKGMKYLELVGLESFAYSHPYELSGGMQQRVAIVRSIVNDPELLLMDEPFGALDAHTRMLLQDELLDIWEKTRNTVLFVTHSVDEAIYLSDKIVVMTRIPGKIKRVIDVDMPRPRNRANPRYGKLITDLLALLEEEVTKIGERQNA